MWRRFRMYIWKQWKKSKTKVANLRKLGTPADRTYQWGNSRLGLLTYRRQSCIKMFHYKQKTRSSGIL